MALDPVIIDFLAKGVPDVQRAFATIQRAAQTASDGVARSAARETQVRDREAQKMARAAEKAVTAETRAKERAAAAAERVIMREQRARELAAKRAADAQIREDERAHRLILRRIAERERARERADAASSRERAKMASSVAGTAMRGASAGINRVGGVASGIARTALELGGGLSLQDAMRKELELSRSAALLANSATTDKRARPLSTDIIARARNVSAATGVDANDLVMATRSYVAKSADYEGGMANMEFFAKLAKGTGTSVEDVTKAAGLVRAQNANLDSNSMKTMLLNVVAQGKLGSVEIEDLASGAARITRSASGYQGNLAENQAKLLGLAQIAARTSGGSVNEAATNLSNLQADAMKHQGAIGKISNDRGQLLAPDKLIELVFDKTQGDLSKMQNQMKFGARSMKFFQAMAPVYNNAYDAASGTKTERHQAAMKAVRDEMSPLINAKYDEKQLDADFSNVMASGAEKFEVAMLKLRQAAGEKLTPAIERLIPVIEQVGPQFVDLAARGLPEFVKLLQSIADFTSKNKALLADLAAHPIGTLVAFEITKSFASAALPELLKGLLTKAFSGAAPGGAGGAGGLGMTGGALAAGGVVAIAETKNLVDAVTTGQRAGLDASAVLPGMLHSKDAKEREAAQNQINEAARFSGAKGAVKAYGALSTLGYHTLSSAVTGEKNSSTETISKFVAARQIIDTPVLKAEVQKAIVEGVRDGVRQSGVTDKNAPARNTPIQTRPAM